MQRFSPSFPICALFLSSLLIACSPEYNWRETHGNTVPFTILLPGKPDSFTQAITLDGTSVSMTMTATEVNGVTFAVGTARFPDEAAAQNALNQMKAALIKNIEGVPIDLPVPGREIAGVRAVTFSANGTLRGKPLQMTGRLYSVEKRVYQIILVGDPKKMTPDAREMFFTSFRPN
ncbi:MAG: rane protein [Herbaspirillum sp.]|nr:rane protein [Herbaspirillum sp.]